MTGSERNNQKQNDSAQAATSFLNFLQRNGSSAQTLASALDYQAKQSLQGSQEIMTPEREAMQAWAAHLAEERQEEFRREATLLHRPPES